MIQLTMPLPERRFDGDTYSPEQDCARLTGAMLKIYEAMKSGQWFTLSHLAEVGGCSEAAASARVRDLRKSRWGAHSVERQRHGSFWVYRMAA